MTPKLNNYIILLICLTISFLNSSAQNTPAGFNYQTTIRDALLFLTNPLKYVFHSTPILQLELWCGRKIILV